ncbi:SMI1/KNR4 family protein [Paenibacillus illinoisensis]|uniref:SMI1/KNR4 family protein n=2 Tax=Paenibacillus illinoisensis TaxID=59845 RepID=UPI00301C5614
MSSKIQEFMNWAESNGWKITQQTNSHLNFDVGFISRYKKIPDGYLDFLRVVEQCTTPDEKTWFLCENEYNNSSDDDFRWNEFELLSLEAAMNDDQWRSEITTWWNHYMPIMISVNGGYSFYAIDLSNETDTIVRGDEPEFEEIKKVANDLDEFLELIMSNSIVFQ